MMINKINNESDLRIEVTFYDEEGSAIDIPDYDFEFEYYVYTNKSKIAKKVGSVFTNCTPGEDDSTKLIIAFDAPNFGIGKLKCKRTLFIPDENFNDENRKITTIKDVAIIC